MQQNLDPSDLPNDLETITDEERFLFRKMGLRMEPFLLLGKINHSDLELKLFSGSFSNSWVILSQEGEDFTVVP